MDQQNKNTTRVQPMPTYFCTKCQKFHYWGKIWKNHKKYARESEPFEEVKTIEWVYAPRREEF